MIKNNDSYCTIAMLQNLYHIQFDNNAEMNKFETNKDSLFYIFLYFGKRGYNIAHIKIHIVYISFLQLNGYLVGDIIHGYQPRVYN